MHKDFSLQHVSQIGCNFGECRASLHILLSYPMDHHIESIEVRLWINKSLPFC